MPANIPAATPATLEAQRRKRNAATTTLQAQRGRCYTAKRVTHSRVTEAACPSPFLSSGFLRQEA